MCKTNIIEIVCQWVLLERPIPVDFYVKKILSSNKPAKKSKDTPKFYIVPYFEHLHVVFLCSSLTLEISPEQSLTIFSPGYVKAIKAECIFVPLPLLV